MTKILFLARSRFRAASDCNAQLRACCFSCDRVSLRSWFSSKIAPSLVAGAPGESVSRMRSICRCTMRSSSSAPLARLLASARLPFKLCAAALVSIACADANADNGSLPKSK